MTRRTTARVIPVDHHGDVPLLGRDPAAPVRRHRSPTGGGRVGVEESSVVAAVRERREERGIVATAAHLGEPFHRWTRELSYDGVDHVADPGSDAVRRYDVPVGPDRLTGPGVGNVLEARGCAPEARLPDHLSRTGLPALARRAVVAATRAAG